LFLGHTGNMSKTYQGKSREELEFYYEMVESKITIQMDEENDEIDRLHEELKKVKEKNVKIDQLEKVQEEMKNRLDKIDLEEKLLKLFAESQRKLDEAIRNKEDSDKICELLEKKNKLEKEYSKIAYDIDLDDLMTI